MKRNFKWVFVGICGVLGVVAAFGAVAMLLWNALMPQIFFLPTLNYLQAAGLVLLARIFFGGIGRDFRGHNGRRSPKGHGQFHHDNDIREKWMNMSEEERKKFFENEKDFFRFCREFSRFQDFSRDGRKEGQNDETGEKKDEGNE